MIALLIKASLVIIVLLAFYKIFLEKESFFAVNRLYLLGCLVAAFVLPFLCLPQLINQQGIVSTLIESTNEKELTATPNEVFLPENKSYDNQSTTSNVVEESSDDLEHQEEILNPKEVNNNATELALTEEKQVPENAKTTETIPTKTRGIGFWLMLIYFFGVIVLSINLLAQIVNTLLKIWNNKDQVEDEDGIIVNMTSEIEPCSFFKYIFINPASYDYETYEQILAHERIHVKQMHSLDLLLSELVVIALWFNPFIWKLRTEVEKNIEYQTDNLLLAEEPEEKEEYQMNLVKIATYTKPLSITTNYNQSLIKQRILKMNTNKSNPYSYWKYTFIVPLVFAILLFLNKPINSFAQTLENTSDFISDNETDQETLKKNISSKISNENISLNKKEENSPILNHKESNQNLSDSEKNSDQNKISKSDANNAEGCLALLQAIKTENVSKVRSLLKSINPDCSHKDSFMSGTTKITGQQTPIGYAARSGNVYIGKLLIEADADLEFQSKDNQKALAIAANNGHSEFVKLLIMNGAKADKTITIFGNDDVASEHIENSDMVIKMTHEEWNNSKSKQLNTSDNSECKALINAVRNNDISKIKELLKSTDPNCIDHQPDYETTNEDGQTWQRLHAKTPLIAAARKGYFNIGKMLIESGAEVNFTGNNGETALIAASYNGNLDFVKYLLGKEADINVLSNGYGSALNAASQEGHTEVVKYLMSKGANINAETNGSGSALVSAAGNGELDVVKYLLEKGANINASTNGSGSALVRAAGNGELEVVKYLLDKGANINAATNGSGSALVRAAGNGEIKMVEYLISKGANVDDATNGSGSALVRAAGNGEIQMVKLLLDKGATIDAATNGSGSALVRAAGNGKIEMVEFLLEKGAAVDGATNGSGSALSRAVQNKKYNTVKLLLEKGANPNFRMSGFDSPMEKARLNNDKKMLKLLRKYE